MIITAYVPDKVYGIEATVNFNGINIPCKGLILPTHQRLFGQREVLENARVISIRLARGESLPENIAFIEKDYKILDERIKKEFIRQLEAKEGEHWSKLVGIVKSEIRYKVTTEILVSSFYKVSPNFLVGVMDLSDRLIDSSEDLDPDMLKYQRICRYLYLVDQTTNGAVLGSDDQNDENLGNQFDTSLTLIDGFLPDRKVIDVLVRSREHDHELLLVSKPDYSVDEMQKVISAIYSTFPDPESISRLHKLKQVGHLDQISAIILLNVFFALYAKTSNEVSKFVGDPGSDFDVKPTHEGDPTKLH